MEKVDTVEKYVQKLMDKDEIEKNDMTLLCMKYGKHMFNEGFNDRYSKDAIDEMYVKEEDHEVYLKVYTYQKVNIRDIVMVNKNKPNEMKVVHYVEGFFGCGCSNCPKTQCPEVDYIVFTLTFRDDTQCSLQYMTIYDNYSVDNFIQPFLYKYILEYVLQPMYIAHVGRIEELDAHEFDVQSTTHVEKLLKIKPNPYYCKACHYLGNNPSTCNCYMN